MVSPKVLLNGAKVFLSTNSPAILTGLGITGTVATAVATGKAVWSLRDIDENITLKDIAGKWKTFIIPVVLASGTILCFIGLNTKYGRMLAAVTSLATLKEQELIDTKNSMNKLFKKGDVEKVKQENAKEVLARNPQPDEAFVIHTNNGNDLFFDPLSGRYFRSSMEHVQKGINEVNEQLNNGNFVALNELYQYWNIYEIDLGDILFMNPSSDPAYHLEILDIDLHQSHVTSKGEAAVVLQWRNDLETFFRKRME